MPGVPISHRRVIGAVVVFATLIVLGSAVPQLTQASHEEVSVEEALAVMDEHGLDCVQPYLDQGVTQWWCDRNMDCEFPDDGISCSSDGAVPTFNAMVDGGPVAEFILLNASFGHATDSPDPPPEARAWFRDLIDLFCPDALAAAREWFDAPLERAEYPGGPACAVNLSFTSFPGSSATYHISFAQNHGAPPTSGVDPCSLLTEQDVEEVLGVEAEPGQLETLPFPASTQYCSYGTEPYELQVYAAASEQTFEDRGESLRALEGQIVEEIDEDGVRALWVHSSAIEIHSNRLSAPMDGGWFTIEFWPLDDAAQASRVDLEPEQREQAIELARIALGLGPVVSSPPSPTAEPNLQPSPTASAGTDGDGDGGTAIVEPNGQGGPIAAPAAPGEFVASIPTPRAVNAEPPVVLQSMLLALAFVVLMPFPAQLFNSTVEEHRDEIRGWFAPLTRVLRAAGNGLDAFWRSPLGIGLFLVASAMLYALLDPAFGPNPEALITLLGIAVGIVLVTILFAIPSVMAHRRHGERPNVEAIPGTLLVGIACVAVSRLADFQPGYLYGLVIGLTFARELNGAEQGRNGALAAALMLAAAVLAWLGLGLLVESGASGLGAAIAETVLAAVMVAGLEGVVFGLLPLRFLPGEPVYAWNRIVWGTVLGIGLFAFFHVLINPSSGYLADSSRTPLLTIIGLLVGFGLLSVVFWAYFRFRPEPADSSQAP